MTHSYICISSLDISSESRLIYSIAALASPHGCLVDTSDSCLSRALQPHRSPTLLPPQPSPSWSMATLAFLMLKSNAFTASLTSLVLSFFTQIISQSCWFYLQNGSGIQSPVTASSATTLTKPLGLPAFLLAILPLPLPSLLSTATQVTVQCKSDDAPLLHTLQCPL